MAAPHVSGVAALVIATKRLGPASRARWRVERHLENTARDAGPGRVRPALRARLLDALAALR